MKVRDSQIKPASPSAEPKKCRPTRAKRSPTSVAKNYLQRYGHLKAIDEPLAPVQPNPQSPGSCPGVYLLHFSRGRGNCRGASSSRKHAQRCPILLHGLCLLKCNSLKYPTFLSGPKLAAASVHGRSYVPPTSPGRERFASSAPKRH